MPTSSWDSRSSRTNCRFARSTTPLSITNLVGIDPDSERLLDLDDGPSPEQGLKAMAGGLIGLPRRTEDYPDKERLALRFEQLKKIGAVRREEVRPLCCYRVIVHKDGGLA
jgi:hypothetical protein